MKEEICNSLKLLGYELIREKSFNIHKKTIKYIDEINNK
jgi:hypothetical protein